MAAALQATATILDNNPQAQQLVAQQENGSSLLAALVSLFRTSQSHARYAVANKTLLAVSALLRGGSEQNLLKAIDTDLISSLVGSATAESGTDAVRRKAVSLIRVVLRESPG